MKCDFCDKPAVGYCSLQIAIYGDIHQERAEKIESDFYNYMDEERERLEKEHD